MCMNVGYTHFIQQSPQLDVRVCDAPVIQSLLGVVAIKLRQVVLELFSRPVCESTNLVAVYGWLLWAVCSWTFQGVGSGSLRHGGLLAAQWIF